MANKVSLACAADADSVNALPLLEHALDGLDAAMSILEDGVDQGRLKRLHDLRAAVAEEIGWIKVGKAMPRRAAGRC